MKQINTLENINRFIVNIAKMENVSDSEKLETIVKTAKEMLNEKED